MRTVLLYVTMQERARNVFDKAFPIKKFTFFGALFKRIFAWEQGISKS